MTARAYDALRRLAEATGILTVPYPESSEFEQATGNPAADEILSRLDEVFGFRVDFPNPFENEYGIKTSRGIASYRAIHALYQAWRASELLNRKPNAKVLEIGAAGGRAAYYAGAFGLLDYTIIDLPIMNAFQAYYLGRVCGEGHVHLFGEKGSPAANFSILPPAAFLDGKETYDLIVNVDSMTELSLTTGRAYWDEIKKRAHRFLSINHEANDVKMQNFLQEVPASTRTRNPSWIRKGHVEEVVTF